ncbi:hypothetical protein SAMN06295885_0460 [Rathayibacter oskolensis]|uniref:Uncharacterized protein n=1 Tax=Rathayibacter oskolensis TaxID=1891671 RepID=A0A1X7N1Z2_9MICO|nr:hypothetical protein [Rathayibacter oskolensis]SMH30672.1 hypothetical protein SAMN06295885_0460 [Rathayibacter oskolensis]
MSTQYVTPRQLPGGPVSDAIPSEVSNDLADHIPGLSQRQIHADLPAYPGTEGSALARDLKRKHVPVAQRAAQELKAALSDAEEALLAVIEQHEARTERHDRLQAYAKKKGNRTIGGSFAGGAGR